MSNPKPAVGARHWRVIGECHIGKFRIMLTKEIVLPRKIRSDKGTHKYPNKGQTSKLISGQGQSELPKITGEEGTLTDPRD